MGYSSKVNPFLSRKTYNAVCEWWARTTCGGQLPLNQMGYVVTPSGQFHAKAISQFTFNKREAADIRFSNNYVTLETPDDISAMITDDLVRYEGILYRVDSIQKRQVTKTREFMKRPVSVYVIQLTR